MSFKVRPKEGAGTSHTKSWESISGRENSVQRATGESGIGLSEE